MDDRIYNSVSIVKLGKEPFVKMDLDEASSDAIELEMLTSGSFDNVMDSELVSNYNSKSIYYNISSHISLADFSMTNKFKYDDMVDILKSIINGLEEIENLFLDPQKCILRMEMIFWEASIKKAYIIYNPNAITSSKKVMPNDLINIFFDSEADFDGEVFKKLVKLRKKAMESPDLDYFSGFLTKEDSGKAYDEPVVLNKRPSISNMEVDESYYKDIKRVDPIRESKESHGEPKGKSLKKVDLKKLIVIIPSVLVLFILNNILKLGFFDSFIFSAIFFSVIALLSGKIKTPPSNTNKSAGVKNVMPIFEKTQVQVSAEILMLKSQSEELEDITISKPLSRVGRVRSNSDIFIPSNLIGRNHAELFFQEEGLYIRDLNTLNGTFVNCRRIPSNTKIRISLGDTLKFAKFEYKIESPY